MTTYQVTVRYGRRFQRYHTFTVEAADAVEALRLAADGVPDEIRGEADLVELREAVAPETRAYMGDEDDAGS
ncbi:MAG: hypothetical protein KY453_02040 [Gemmatimonadetes bacterium]|nr:hypothetical protein [Gemmatimonadota bacterium]